MNPIVLYSALQPHVTLLGVDALQIFIHYAAVHLANVDW